MNQRTFLHILPLFFLKTNFNVNCDHYPKCDECYDLTQDANSNHTKTSKYNRHLLRCSGTKKTGKSFVCPVCGKDLKQEEKYYSHPHVKMMNKTKAGAQNEAGYVKYILKTKVWIL